MRTTKASRSRQSAKILAGSIAALLAAYSAHAASDSWNLNANGDWATAANWLGNQVPGATGDAANLDIATISFLLTAPRAITVDANRGIGGISFGNTSVFGYTLTGGNLLLNNAGVIQTLLADGAHMDTIASAIAIQGDGGSASFTANATSGSNLLNIGAVTGVSTGVNITTLNLNGTNIGGNVITGIVGDGAGGGKLAITKSAAGNWQLNGSNTYTGTTTITLGTLIANNAAALGIGGDMTFGGGTLQYTAISAGQDWSTRFKNTTVTGILLNTSSNDVTLAGAIDATNTAGLTKSGGGTLTLSGANLYTGVTTIGGTVNSILRLNNSNALGGGGNITFTGGRLRYTTNNTVDYSTRIVSSTAAIALDTNGQNVSLGSALANTNTGGLNKLGAGDLTFGGNVSHLYTGTTSVNGGRLILDNTGAGNNNADRIVNGSSLTLNNGTFLYKGSDQVATDSSETVGAINVGTGTLTVSFGGTNVATLTGSSLGQSNRGSTLVNGTNLGMDTASTASVARLKITGAPTLFGTTNALDTGINAAAQDTKIVAFLVGEATATTGGTGTATGAANTFVTWNANTGLRPLNPTDEFVNNSITVAKNNYVTSATTAAATGAINSLVINGADLTIDSGVNLTDTSGAILFASSNTIKTIGGASGFLFTGGNQEYLISVNSGVTATISSAFTGTADGNQIAMSGGGTLNLRGNSTLNTDTNTGKTSRLVAEGGGTLNVTGVIMAYATLAINKGNGTNLVGQTSSGNTLNVSETGRLRAGGMTIGGDIFGNNSVTISSPGNSAAPSYHMNGNGAQLNMGVSSSGNTFTVSNGAYVRQDQGGGTNAWTIGTNAGGDNNAILITGIGSTVNRGGAAGSEVAIGGVGNNNSITVNSGGNLTPRRTRFGFNGGSGNFGLITGQRSSYNLTVTDSNNVFALGGGVGSQNNYFSVEAGATATIGNTVNTTREFNVGYANAADNNYVRVTGPTSLITMALVQPWSFGGTDRGTGTTPVDFNAKGNHLDVFDRGILVTTTVEMMGVSSAFNLGNGSGISTATVSNAPGHTQTGVVLRNADSRLNFNGGRLIAGAAGSLVSGLGIVVLNGPAYFSTTQTNSAISAVIADGTGNSLTKEGSGTLILSASNTYTGSTVVNAGTLALDFTAAGGRLADASTLVLGGGTLDLRNGASTEVIASTSLTAGRSGVTRSIAGSTLRMNTITPGVGIVNFGAANIADTDNLNDASDAGGILGAWATVGGTDWAVNFPNAADGAITAYAAYTDYDAFGSTLVNVAANNARLNAAAGAGNIGLGAAVTTINTLLQINPAGAAAATVNTVGAALETNGIMIGTGSDAVTIGVTAGDGSLRAATAGANLVLNNNNTSGTVDMTINAPILANGASGLATAGRVVLNGVNTFTGATGVGGTLTIGGAGQLGSGSYAGAISIAAGGSLVMNTSANQTLGGVISGDGSFTQSGTGTTTLNGANTYTGTTTVNDGALVAGNATAFGSAITAALVFGASSSGTVRLNGNNITLTVLNTNSTPGTPTIESGSGVAGTDTLTLEAGRTTAGALNNSTYAGVLQNGSTRALALVKNGPADLTLSGNNTHSGGTTINAGSLTLASQTGLGTGTLTLAEGALFQQSAFEGNTAGGAIPNVINLSGGQVFFNMPITQKDIWLDQDVTGVGTMRLLSDGSGRTLTLSGAKTFLGGIVQTSGSLVSTGTGSGQHPSVAIDNVASLGLGTFRAQINSTNTSVGVLRTLADLSAGSGVTNAFELAASSRLVAEVADSNHLKLSGVISGNGNLIKTGSATLTLSGANTYTGSTTITAGTLSVGADANLGGPNAVIFNGGTLQVTGTAITNFGSHTPAFIAGKVAGFDIADAANTFTVSQVLNQTTGGLIKSGPGVLALSNTNTYTGSAGDVWTSVNAGVLRLDSANALPGGIGLAGGTSQLIFNGGVVGLNHGNFSRSLDAIGLATSANFEGPGGWAAYTANRTVDIGGAAATVDWGLVDTGLNGQTLILGAATADMTVTLLNPLDLGAAARTLQVDNGTAADDAIVSGAVSSTLGGSLVKTGDGAVQLNGGQSYDALTASAGTTNVNALLGTAPGMAVVTVDPGGAKLRFGTVSQTLASLSIGAGSTVIFTSGAAAGSFTGGGGGGKGFGGGAVVPEPGTLGLLLVGILGLLNRRRRM
jgi:autotransporter-associated beta strand protein